MTAYMQSALNAVARPSVCHVGGSVKNSWTTEWPTTSSFCAIRLIQKFWQVPPERGIKQGWGEENELFFSFVHRYLENGTRYDQSYC